MRKILCALSVVLLLLSLSFPAFAADEADSQPVQQAETVTLEGVAYYDISSSLGNVTLYLPQSFSVDTLQVVNGQLFNTSNSTVYLYCPQFPEYTFSAARFDVVSYRTGNNYNSAELTNVSLLSTSESIEQVYKYIVIFAVVLIIFLMIWRGRN